MILETKIRSSLTRVCAFHAVLLVPLFGLSQKCCDDWKSVVPKEAFQKNVTNETLTYRMLLNGDSLGFTTLTYSIDQNIVSIKENVEAIFNRKLMKETIHTSYNYETSEMIKGSLFINYDGNEVEIGADWTSDGINLTSSIKDSLIRSESSLQRFLGVFLLPKLIHDLPNGMRTSYNQFYLGDAGFREVTLSPSGKTYLMTPLGRKDVDILNAKGGLANQIFYIDQSHRIVQIEIPDMGWVYEIIQIKTGQ